MITLPRRSFLLGAATLAAPALIIRTPGLPPKVVPSLLMPEKPELVEVMYRLILTKAGVDVPWQTTAAAYRLLTQA
jgi:hypothetical protein